MTATYLPLQTAVEQAGFYAVLAPTDGGGSRLLCASKRGERGLTGNSFWVAWREGRWIVGGWSGAAYVLPDPAQSVAFVLACLRLHPEHTRGDFDASLREEFGLVPLPEDYLL